MQGVTAIVVTHNSEHEVGACLDALRNGCSEVIVVDNASGDGTLQEVRRRPWVRVVAKSENLGFAGGVNAGVRQATGTILLLMNPDAVLTSGLEPLIAACAQHGIAAGALTDLDGQIQAGFTVRSLPTPAALAFECLGLNRSWARNPVNRRYRRLDADLTKPASVEQPAGAFLMIRRDVFDKLGGFDERFWPVWFEDVDFCRRALDAGYEISYVPSVTASHAGGHSVRQIPSGFKQLYWYGSLLKYARKYYSSLAFRVICFAVIIGSLFRVIAGIRDRRDSAPFSIYRRVIRLAASNLFASSAQRNRRQCEMLESRTVDGR